MSGDTYEAFARKERAVGQLIAELQKLPDGEFLSRVTAEYENKSVASTFVAFQSFVQRELLLRIARKIL